MHEFSERKTKRLEKEKNIGRKDLHNVHYYSLDSLLLAIEIKTTPNEKLTQTPPSWAEKELTEMFLFVRVDGVYCRDQRLLQSFHLVFLFAWRFAASSLVSTNFRSKLQILQRVSFRFIKSIGKQEKFPISFAQFTTTTFSFVIWRLILVNIEMKLWLLCQLIEEFRSS